MGKAHGNPRLDEPDLSTVGAPAGHPTGRAVPLPRRCADRPRRGRRLDPCPNLGAPGTIGISPRKGLDMIETRSLTKRYGRTTAVDELSFRIEPGRVTGFPGPNGAGKSTTMRMILGLDRPTAGVALIDGKR